MKDTLDIIREHKGFPTSASKDTLLPCPFCGGLAWMAHDEEDPKFDTEIYCINCGASIREIGKGNKKKAVAKWNRRAE